jgi:hypothetical protein
MTNVNGIPLRLSLPNVSSGFVTPISQTAIGTDDMPVIEPTHPAKPTFANECPSPFLVCERSTMVQLQLSIQR